MTAAAGAQMPQRSDARRNRDRLLDAATELLESTGAHFTLPDLARQAGVGSATVYRHFAGIADLLAAVEVRSIQALTTAIEALDSGIDARQRFDDICGLWIDRSIRESAAVRFLRSPEGVLQRVDRGDPSMTALVRSLREVIGSLVSAGTLPDQDDTVAALLWMSLFDERIVVDLGRTHGWTAHRIVNYLSRAVLGALGGDRS